jgi:hypothetical protein
MMHEVILLAFVTAAFVASAGQWLALLRRHGVSALWLATPFVLAIALWASPFLGAVGVPLFYVDPPMWEPGEGGRPLWTLGWWTVGGAVAGTFMGAAQAKLLRPSVAGTWRWVVTSGVAWAATAAALWWPWSPLQRPSFVSALVTYLPARAHREFSFWLT